jgi:hypothetical protein
VDFPVCDLFEESGSVNIVDEVERKTRAYLAVDSEGFLEICGSKMAVALASSTLDQMKSYVNRTHDTVSKDINENLVLSEDSSKSRETAENLETEVVWKRREPVKPKVVKPSKANENFAKECSSGSVRDEVKDSNNTEKSSNIDEIQEPCVNESINIGLVDDSVRRSTEDPPRSQDSITESKACDGHELESPNLIVGESLRDFALKLRYTESEVSLALSKLGPEADNNMLLMELVKAQNSAKQIEEGSSLERPLSISSPPVVNDPSTFRSIVIDGSNVAMR